MIGVIDYEAGNLASVTNALRSIDASVVVSSDSQALSACDGIILPGVGAAPLAMRSLQTRDLVSFIRSLEVPFLGICLGMQLLYDKSNEGDTRGIGIVSGEVEKFGAAASRVPHMGWNRVTFAENDPLAHSLGENHHFYFAHSYYASVSQATTATAECGLSFSAAIRRDNYFGVQFHPEKSGNAGLQLLRNFCSLCESFQRST